MAEAGGAVEEVANAWAEAEAEPGPGGGDGSGGGSDAAGPGAEPGSVEGAGAGGGLVLGEKGSPLGWSLVLYKPSGQWGSGQRESCWAGHADEPASPTPGCVATAVC